MTARAIFVAVDDTLARFAGAKQIPNPGVIQVVRELHATGAGLYLWSTGGSDYCRKMAEGLRLAGCFAAYLPKRVLMSTTKLSPIGEIAGTFCRRTASRY